MTPALSGLEPPPQGEGHRRSATLAACGLCLLAALVLWLFIGRGSAAFTADDAIACLMARDIAHLRDAPVFFSGQEYLGALDSYWLAAFFAVLPEDVSTFRVAFGVLFVCTVLAVWRLTSLAFGQRAGLVAGLYLVVGPPFLHYKALSAGYGAVLLMVALLLLLLVQLEARIQADRSTGATLGLLGLTGGLAWWLHPLCGVVVFSALAAVAVGGVRRHMLRGSRIGILALAFMMGSLPWWLRNLRTGFASLAGPELTRLPLGAALSRAPALVTESLSIFYGGGSVAAQAPFFEGAWVVTGSLFLLVAVSSLWLACRAGGNLGRYTAAICAPLLLVTPALVVLNPIADFREPRYLFPVYVVTAVVTGAALTRRVRQRWLQAVLALAIFGFAVHGHTRFDRFGVTTGVSQEWARLASEELLASGVSSLFASYWDAYPITFSSGGRVIGTPFGWWNRTRRRADLETVAGSPNPAFLLGQVEAGRLEEYLRRSSAKYSTRLLAGKVLIKDVEAVDLAQAKSCLCVPAGWKAGVVEWLGVAMPQRVSTGATFTATVRLRHHLQLPWPQNASLSYHWRTLDRRDVVFDNVRTPFSASPEPGTETAVPVLVVAPESPGEYLLVFDVVEEGVAWLESLGNSPLERRMTVRN